MGYIVVIKVVIQGLTSVLFVELGKHEYVRTILP